MTVWCHDFRNNSTKDLECYASEVISMNRMMQQHLLISEPTSFFIGNRDENLLEELLEETDSGDDLFMPSIKLSPPCSGLAKRRTCTTLRNLNTSGEQSDGVDSLPSSHSSTFGVSVQSFHHFHSSISCLENIQGSCVYIDSEYIQLHLKTIF